MKITVSAGTFSEAHRAARAIVKVMEDEGCPPFSIRSRKADLGHIVELEGQ